MNTGKWSEELIATTRKMMAEYPRLCVKNYNGEFSVATNNSDGSIVLRNGFSYQDIESFIADGWAVD